MSTTAPSVPGTGAFANEPSGVLFGLPMPMGRAMALHGEAVGADRVRVRMRYQAEQTNSRGAVATLLDCTPAPHATPPSSP